MDSANSKIVIIDDDMKETDPLLVQMKRSFNEVQIILKRSAKDGLKYIMDNLRICRQSYL